MAKRGKKLSLISELDTLEVQLEQISKMNLVDYWKPELITIRDTGKAPSTLGVNPRKRLIKDGLLRCTARGTSPTSFKLTPLAIKLLDKGNGSRT